jgi:hypothetical protein
MGRGSSLLAFVSMHDPVGTSSSRAGARHQPLFAGPAPRVGDVSLLVQGKVTKRKHTRSLAARKARAVPCAPRATPGRRWRCCATRQATVDGVTQAVRAHIPRQGGSSQRAQTRLQRQDRKGRKLERRAAQRRVLWGGCRLMARQVMSVRWRLVARGGRAGLAQDTHDGGAARPTR